MIKSLIGIFIGVGVAILGIVLIAVPTTGLDGSSITSGFNTLKTIDVVKVFTDPNVGMVLKAGVGLAVYIGPIIAGLGLIAFIMHMFKAKK